MQSSRAVFTLIQVESMKLLNLNVVVHHFSFQKEQELILTPLEQRDTTIGTWHQNLICTKADFGPFTRIFEIKTHGLMLTFQKH